jgi:hypothetical protein
MIKDAIDRYEAGAAEPARAIKGLSREELNAFPVPGTWSVQQVIVHLMDSDLIGADRMKRIAAMERPLLIGYDESAFMATLHPERVDAAGAAEVFRLNRVLTAAVMRSLPKEAFERWGVHNEKGKVTLLHMLEDYCEHLDHHLKFVAEKRKKLGK